MAMKLDTGMLVRNVLVHWELQRERRVYGVTFFLNDRLWVVWVDEDAKGNGLIRRESLPYESGADETAPARLREKIQAPSDARVSWIHLVFRCSGLVKTFALPENASDSMESALRRRVREEIPHLADEVIYYARTQERSGVQKPEGLMFGVPKNVLKDQLSYLGRVGIFPERVMLSTEILAWLYTQEPLTEDGRGDGILYRVFSLEGQGEILSLKGQALLQSQWVHLSEDGGFGQALPMAEETFWPAAVRAHRADAAFDFSPVELEGRRAQEQRTSTRRKLVRSATILSLAFFVFAAAQVFRSAVRLGALHLQAAPVEKSVAELKKMQREALASRRFQAKKAMPALLIDALRRPMAPAILLEHLEYDEPESKFLLRGRAESQNDVNGYVAVFQGQNLFSVNLNRLEAAADKPGAGFLFELAGAVQTEEGTRA